MRLILEGADNSGKTTLADTLLRGDKRMVYHHPGGRPKNQIEELACLEDQFKRMTSHTHILMDRCTSISQQIYSPDKTLDIGRAANLRDLLDAGVVIVYCRPSTDWLMSFENFTWREGETDEFKQEIIDKQHVFIQRYDDLMQWVPHVHFDYRGDDAAGIIGHLIYAIRGHADSIQLINKVKTFEVPA